MSKRTIVLALGAIMAMVVGWQVAAFASHGDVTLTGSNFEIDNDANLVRDHAAPSIDWASVTEIRKADTPSGPNDESFGEGTKENTANPTVVDGSIPPNKSDLKFFGLYQEGGTSSGFLNLFWSRVQEPSGTTNMDFELNQNKCEQVDPPTDPPTQTADSNCAGNGITPKRTKGDILITYDLSNGGTVATISFRKWTAAGNWGPSQTLTDPTDPTVSDGVGTINDTPILDAGSDGLGAHSRHTFGEAQVRLSALFTSPTTCQSFGSAYLKSRSSDAFNSAVKDFVPPASVNITNCGSVKITKTDDASPTANPLSGAQFTLYNDLAPTGGSRGAEDTITTLKCTTIATGICTITNVPFGEYWVVESITPTGYDTVADTHASVTSANPAVEVGPLVDPAQKGAIQITKTAKHFDTSGNTDPNLVAGFTVKNSNGDVVATVNTDASGKACVDGLALAGYSVSETNVPAGYSAQTTGSKSVTVDNKAKCSDAPYVGEKVSFVNDPLSNIQVSFNSQVDGATAAKISCAAGQTGLTADPADATPNDFDDTSESFKNLKEGTYTCTVVVDP